jgi:hypothetical protein
MRIGARARYARLSVAVILLLALPAGSARASSYSQVLQSYEQTGSIAACKFSSSELSGALKGVDTYGAQYFQDFTNAVQAALDARAAGSCARGAAPGGGRAPQVGPLHDPATGSVTTSTQAGTPAPVVILAVIAGLLALAAAAFALFRTRGWDPPWLAASRHTWAETGFRVGGTWDEFRDWRRSA